MPIFNKLKIVLSGKLIYDLTPNHIIITTEDPIIKITLDPNHVTLKNEGFTSLIYKPLHPSNLPDLHKLVKGKIELMAEGQDMYQVEYMQATLTLPVGKLDLPVEFITKRKTA